MGGEKLTPERMRLTETYRRERSVKGEKKKKIAWGEITLRRKSHFFPGKYKLHMNNYTGGSVLGNRKRRPVVRSKENVPYRRNIIMLPDVNKHTIVMNDTLKKTSIVADIYNKE